MQSNLCKQRHLHCEGRLPNGGRVRGILPLVLLTIVTCGYRQEPFEQARERMVQNQIMARGVRDTSTLRAMRSVQRHKFVPPGLSGYAYGDSPLSIGFDQTISQPYIVALMTELIKPRRGQRILEIGTGSGYQAAVLAEIVDSVFSANSPPRLRIGLDHSDIETLLSGMATDIWVGRTMRLLMLLSSRLPRIIFPNR